MGTLTAPEIREYNLSPKERAQARDCFVREFERQWADWVSIAKVCLEVERDRDYELLGFQSWHAWLLAAAPRSRSYIYLVVGRFKELSADISEKELAEIPLGSAGVLKQLSPSVRKEFKIRQAAKKKPSEFRQVVKDSHPEQAIETIIEKKLHFTLSQWAIIESAYEQYCATENDVVSLETFIEYLVSEVMLGGGHQERRAHDPERAGLH